MRSFDYRGRYAYHVVLTTHDRASRFFDRAFAHQCVDRLRATADRYHFRLLAYCVMPDHAHILVLGDDDEADLVRFVQHFKQVTSYSYRRATGARLWQQSFYDRVVRGDEDLSDVADYVFSNPLLAGVANDARGYPLSGGEYFESDGAEAPSLRPGAAERKDN
jgi:REP element-mobilizing transposase RayT